MRSRSIVRGLFKRPRKLSGVDYEGGIKKTLPTIKKKNEKDQKKKRGKDLAWFHFKRDEIAKPFV